MPRYRITDNTSGRTLLIEGDSPPTEADAIELFAGQPAEAPPADSARAAQSAAAPVVNREAEMKRRYGLGLSRAQRTARDDKSQQISAVEDTALRIGVPVAAALAAPATGGLSLLAGAAGGFTGEVMAQEREMERGVRDQASYGQMIAAPIITGTPLGPAFKGAAYANSGRLLAGRPAAVATRAAFGGAISGGANAISQAIDTGEVDGADVLKSAAYGALFGGAMGGVETVQTTRAMKAKILDLRQRTGDFKSTDLEFVAKMRRAGQNAPSVSPDAMVPAGGRTGAPDGPPPVVQPAAPASGMPPFDPNVRAVDVVLPRPPPRPPAPPSAPTQVAPPEPPPAPVDNAPVGAPPPAAIESAPPVPPDKMSATQVSPVAAGSPPPDLPEPAPVMGESPEPAFYDLISGRIDSPEVDSYMRQQMQSAEERWANLSEQERFVAHAEFGTTNPVILKDGSFPYDLTPSRFSEIVGSIEGARTPVAAPANQTPEPALDQQIIAAELAAARATSRFREAGKWSELKGQNARQRWQTLKSQKLAAERALEDLRAQVEETPPAPVTVPPAAPPGAPGFPAAVVSTGATSRPAPATVLPAASEVKPASRRQIAQQRAEVRRLTKLADQAAQTSPERAGQYTAQAQQAREKLGEMESNTTTGSTPQVGPDPLGNADLLTQIADYVGKINMTPPANNVGGEYDGLAAAFSRGAARLLRSSEGGSNIVNAIGELNAAAGTKFESASQFFEAVDRAVSRRQSVARDLDRQAYRDKVEGMVQTDTKKGRPRALVPSAPNVIDEVGVGGEFKLNKEKFSVIDTDEGPGGITLYVIQDGHRFTIPEGTPIYPDKGSLKPAEVAPQKPATAGPQSDDPFGDNYVPEADAAPASAPTPSTQNEFVARSQELQRILRAAGYSKGDGVSTAGLQLVSALANKNKLRQWPDTQTIADYDALIAVVRDDLNLAAGTNSSVATPTPGTQTDLVAGIERQAAAPALTLESASVGQQAAEAQAAREAQLVAKRRADMLAANDRPLTGDSSNVNQGQLYAEDADMFSGASAQEVATRAPDSKVEIYNAPIGLATRSIGGLKIPSTSDSGTAAMVMPIEVMPNATTSEKMYASFVNAAKQDVRQYYLANPQSSIRELYEEYKRSVGRVITKLTKTLSDRANLPDEKVVREIVQKVAKEVASNLRSPQPIAEQTVPETLNLFNASAQDAARMLQIFAQTFPPPPPRGNKPGPNDAEAGRISPDALFPLARAVLGGAFGYLEGDTPEEKLAFAMAGALGLGVLGSRRLARRVLAALKPDRTAVPSYPFDPGQPLRAIDKQGRVVGTHTMGALEHVRAIEMPELVHLARQLSGNDVLLRTFPKSHGMFRHRGEDFRIELDRRIFADPVSAQRTMAHELGHMIDYLDDKTMNRGNLLGRLAALREHLATTLPDTPWNPNQALQPKERVKLRREAEKEIGKRPPQDEEADLAAWKEAVAKSYAEKVEEVIADRGLLKDQEIRAELIGVSEWWRPYEADKVSAGYIDYRNSSVELYADALSVLFNAPSELRDRAPLFFAGWMAYLDRKPEAKHALQDAWHFLHQGQVAVVAARNDRIKAGFVKAEEFLINHARERELDRTTLRGIIDQTKQEWWNIYQPIIAKGAAVKAAGVKLPWHQDPEFFFDSHALAENQNYLLLERLQRTVVNPVEASGLTRADLGLYLLHNRVLNESYLDRDGAMTGRSVLANPQGITPLQARIALLVRRVPPKHATPEQREAHRARELGLETAARTVQDAFHDLVRDGHQAGIFSDENLALSAANRYNYAPFAVVDYLLRSDRVPAGISRQLGTLHDVANPYLTFVLKGMAVAKLTELNRATTLTVDLLTRYFPGEIERAPERKVALADGSMMTLPPPPPPRGKATLTLLRKGKREAYYVDPSYAKMFDDQMPASAHVVAKVLNYTMRNFFHPLFITYNPGFVYAANPMADTLRSYYALPPGAQRRKWIAENRAAWETARARVAQDVTVQDMPRKRALVALRKQRPLTPAEAVELKVLEARALAFEAVATRALASPADSFAQTGGNTDDLWGRMLRDHSLISDEPGRFLKLAETYLPHIVKTAKMVERHGMMSEALPKLAAYNMIGKTAGWSKEQVAFYVRNNIGTPNTYKRGSRAVVNGAFLPYINVFTRGMESDLAVARGKVVGPESRGRKAAEFWRRMTESSFVPSLLQALAMVGAFGAALKKCYDGFSEYDKMNYLIIPLGTWETDTVHGYKSAGIRIRLTETMRFTNSFLQHVVTRAADNDPAASASLGHLFEFGAGQVPGAHPLVKLGGSWAQFAAGIQPRDNFRGSPVVQTADWKAGGWERTKGMLAYTWNDSGLGGMVRFDSKSQNIMEFTASATPVVNRLIRFSDSGLREREERFDKREAETIYKIRSQMPRSVNELLQEYSALQSVGDRRDDRQQVRYKELGVWHLKVWTPTYQEMKIAPPKDWRTYGEGLGIDSEPYQRKNQK